MPSRPPVSSALSRRGLLAAAGAVGLGAVAGCTSSDPPAATGPSPGRATTTPPPQPDVGLAAAVLRHERHVLARVEATAGRHPTIGGSLEGARRAHRAHVLLLERAVPDGTTPAPAARPPASATVPATVPAALAALARAEDVLATQDRRSALAADSGAFARVLASMAAAATQQATVLGAAAARAAR